MGSTSGLYDSCKPSALGSCGLIKSVLGGKYLFQSLVTPRFGRSLFRSIHIHSDETPFLPLVGGVSPTLQRTVLMVHVTWSIPESTCLYLKLVLFVGMGRWKDRLSRPRVHVGIKAFGVLT